MLQGEDLVPSTATNEWTSLSGLWLTGIVKLHRGRWNLSLRAFVNQSDVNNDDKFILSGTREGVEIGTNNMVTQTVSINLGYVRQEGDGTLHVSATYPVVYREGANPESPVEAVRKVKVTANVAGTDYTGDITAFDSNNVGTLDLTVPAGAAHVTVQYYMDDSTLFEDDQTARDVLIMATMTTNLAVSVDRDITVLTFKAEQPEGTVEDNVIPKVFNSLFDIYPGPIADNEIVVGYAEETKALGAQTPITYPYTIYASATPDGQGRYKAADLGLVPITVTTRNELNASSATEAWWGKTATSGSTSTANTTLASVRFVDGVAYIRDYAFVNCSGLTSVTIPDGVNYIGNSAFEGCSGLTNITIPDSVTSIYGSAFKNCTGLTSVTIPDGVTYIGPQTFKGCTGLTSITIPDSVTSIGQDTFQNCTSLTDIYVNQPKNDALFANAGLSNGCTVHWVVTLNSMFDVFPDTATTSDCVVGYRLATDEAVSYPYVLSSAASPNEKGQYNATDLGLEPVIVTPLEMVQNGQANGWDKAWVGPDAIISEEDAATLNVENGDGMALKEIRFTGVSYAQGVWGAFAPGKVVNFSCGNLVNLEKVVLPDDIEYILPGQFTNCMRLKDINFPASLQGAPFYVFLNCISLADININSNITTVDNGAGLPYDGSLIDIGFADTNPIYQEIIQDVLNTRGEDPYTWQYNYTFGPGVSQLWRVVSRFSTSFVIPEGIEELHHTFEGCERLTIDGITFPSTLKVIEEHTFGGCLGFTGTFEIPETVEKLGDNVFTGCDNLEKVVIPSSVTELTGNPFGVDHSDNYPGTVEYKGTMEQWNQITGASNVTTHAITCSDGVIPKP